MHEIFVITRKVEYALSEKKNNLKLRLNIGKYVATTYLQILKTNKINNS